MVFPPQIMNHWLYIYYIKVFTIIYDFIDYRSFVCVSVSVGWGGSPCVWKPEVDFGYLPIALSTLVFETRSFTEPEFYHFRYTSWPGNH